MKLSIVSPVYKGEKMLHELVTRIHEAVSPIYDDFEIILVNDASPDDSWSIIEQICATDPKVKGVNLSRNFGQHYAITAGLSLSSGEAVVVMDCDLQDRPEEIPNLITKLNEGYDSVFAQRTDRQDSFLKKLGSTCFYRVFSYLTETTQDGTVANFGIYKKSVVESILSMKDAIRYLPAMAQWVGFRQAYLPVTHSSRAEGSSSYSLLRLIKLAFDTIISFSNKPIKIMLQLGFLIIILTLAICLYFLIKYFFIGIPVTGFTALILSVWLSTGFLVTLIASTGIYIGQIFNQVKERPCFIVSKKLNF